MLILRTPGWHLSHSLLAQDVMDTYTLFHENILKFFFNIVGLPERRNKRKSVLEITKMYYF